MAIPVYIFTGFLESGKTTLIKETLADPNFTENEKTLLIVCEEGEVEYSQEWLNKMNTTLLTVENQTVLDKHFFQNCEWQYEPDRIMIEFNGTWSVANLLNVQLPKEWILLQILATVNAQTFASAMSNMRSIFFDQLAYCEMVIFNRCDDTCKKSFLRSNIKAINKGAQIIYEDIYGRINELKEDELPFDVKASHLMINEDDYGLWYMDALENPEKYRSKQVTFKGKILRRESDPEDTYVIGRMAMVCCSDDTQLIGYLCKSSHAEAMVDGDWLELTAKMSIIYDEDYGGDVPYLHEVSYQRVHGLKDDLVYFS